MNFDAILAALPQAHPFVFVDRIEALEPGVRAEGRVTFAADHPVFDGHLPGNPIVPGVILIEAMAQLCATVLIDRPDRGEPPAEPAKVMGYLAEVRRIRFRRPVRPGEEVSLHARLGPRFGSAASFEVSCDIAGDAVAQGEIVVGGMGS